MDPTLQQDQNKLETVKKSHQPRKTNKISYFALSKIARKWKHGLEQELQTIPHSKNGNNDVKNTTRHFWQIWENHEEQVTKYEDNNTTTPESNLKKEIVLKQTFLVLNTPPPLLGLLN